MRTIREIPLWLRLLACACVVLAVALAVGSIRSAQAQEPGELKPLSDYPDIIQAWEGSAHGNTYDEGKGPNTYCSRCHSPQNWDPASRPGPPPNCITCKFPTDPELRIAPTMDFVSREDWVGIACSTCHVVEGDMIDATSIAWFNPIAEEYEPVATANELCGKCHTNSTGVSETGGRGVDHEIILGGSAHRNWAATIEGRRPDYCSDCHDPHTQQPMACMDCHGEVAELDTHIKGMNAIHLEKVQCIACHDASGAAVGPHPDEAMGGVWTTLEKGVSRSGEPTVTPIVSHSVQWEVSCDRCHYADNEWGLIVLNADGTVPE